MEAPIRWPWGCRVETTRIIVQLHTDDGLVGLGETMGNDAVLYLMQQMVQSIQGEDPFNLERILAKISRAPYFSGYSGYAAIAGFEMACWDLMGKALGRPVYELIGGRYRDRVEFSAYVFYRYRSEDGIGGETTPDEVLEFCQGLQRDHGFKVYKFKGGVFPPEEELEVLKALRAGLGPQVGLRIDVNGVWRPGTALRMARALEPLDFEYLEDLTWGLENMSRLRKDVPVPFATNMCVVDFDQIPLAVRLGGIDIILGDCHKWGGIWATKKLAGICESFGFGMSMHSGAELGISTAANLQVVASTPVASYAIDGHYHHLSDDVIVGGKLKYQDGAMEVPTAPGLGVELDPDKLAVYHERFKRAGEKPFVSDERRPDWVPERYLW